MDTVWSELILARVLSVTVGAYESGQGLDDELADTGGTRLHMAEAISLAIAVYGVGLPDDDLAMVAILDKYGRPTTARGRGVVLGLSDGRLALSAGRAGVVESAGPNLALVNTPPLSVPSVTPLSSVVDGGNATSTYSGFSGTDGGDATSTYSGQSTTDGGAAKGMVGLRTADNTAYTGGRYVRGWYLPQVKYLGDSNG